MRACWISAAIVGLLVLVPSPSPAQFGGGGWKIESVWYKPRNPRTGASILECGQSGKIVVSAVLIGPGFAEEEEFYSRPVRIGVELLLDGERVSFERRQVEKGISAVREVEDMGDGRWLIPSVVSFPVRCSSVCEVEVSGRPHADRVTVSVRAGTEKFVAEKPEEAAEPVLTGTGEFEGKPVASRSGTLSCVDARYVNG